MQLKQANTLLAAAMVVVAVIVLAACCLIFLGRGKARDALESRDNDFESLHSTYRKANPFPSDDNVRRMRENIGVVSNGFETLLSDFGKGISLARPDNATVFSSRREEVLGRLYLDAPVGHTGSRIVPEGFQFGFDAFRDGHSAQLKHIPRLLLQLDIIDAIVREMYAAHVSSILSVEREVFDSVPGSGSEEEEVEEEPASRRGRGGRGGRGRGGRGREAASDDGEGSGDTDILGDLADSPVPLNRQKFHFSFEAKEESLVDLLNRLAQLPMYVAVTRLEFEKTGSDIAEERAAADAVERPTARRARPGRGRRPGVAAQELPEEPAGAPDAPAGRLARLFSGPKLESPIRVQLDVEVYNIHRPDQDDSQAEDSTEE